MSKRTGSRKSFWMLSAVFGVIALVALIIGRLFFRDHPLYLVAIISISCGYLIVYRSRESKLKKRRVEIKNQTIQVRKAQEVLSLDINEIPKGLQHVKKCAEKWGSSDPLIREDLYNNTSREELIVLKECVEQNINALEEYVNREDGSNESIAIQNMYKAYEELGLWTWEKE